MIPSPITLIVLALAAFRTYRLVSHDTLPALVNLRSCLVGAQGKNRFDRPQLAEWISCAYCSGAWWAAGWYLSWLAWPHGTLYPAVPLALSAAVALIQTATSD